MKRTHDWIRLGAYAAMLVASMTNVGMLGSLLGSAPHWAQAPGVSPTVRHELKELVINDVIGWIYAGVFFTLILRHALHPWRRAEAPSRERAAQ